MARCSLVRLRLALVAASLPALLASVASPVGAQLPPGQPVRVSVAWNGGAADGPSESPAVDAGARCVAFQSMATNLVPGDTNGVRDVFVRDLASSTTSRVSVSTAGTEGNGASFDPRVSGDCRFVAFVSVATNLVPGDTNGIADVFVHDRVTRETSRVSVFGDPPAQAARGCSSPDISADGRLVAFDTAADSLSGDTAVFVHDRQSSITAQVPVPGHVRSRRPAISADGRYVALMTYTRGSVPGDVYDDRVWLRDRVTGTTRPLAVIGGPEVGLDPSGRPAIDGSGRLVSYVVARPQAASWLSPALSVEVHDTVTGLVRTVTTEFAVNAPARPGLMCSVRPCGNTLRPALAAGGRQVAFAVHSADPTYLFDLFTSDLVDGTTVFLGSVAALSSYGPSSRDVALSADGLVAAFAATDVGNVNLNSEQPHIFLLSLDSDGDTMPDAWEHAHGLDAFSPADATRDADGDGRTNQLEHLDGTHPRGLFRQYLAEGATGSFFATDVTLAATGYPAAAVVEFQRADGSVSREHRRVWEGQPERISVGEVPGMATAEFSTVVESDVPLVADRTMTWDRSAYGSHAETAIASPRHEWYLAEGATHSGFQLFYLVQNPNATPVDVEVTYLLPAPASPLVGRYAAGPTSRLTIWVNVADPRLASTDVSAIVSSVSGGPILVERAMYLGRPGQFFAAGTGGAAIAAPATEWIVAEGATGALFDLFVLIANPGTDPADVSLTYLLPDGSTIERRRVVAPRSRETVWVDLEHPRLADTAVATVVTSINGTPVVVERAMWWPGPTSATWHEAHVAAGVTRSSRRWMLAVGARPAGDQDTFVLIANPSSTTATATVSATSASASAHRDLVLPPRSRTNVWVEQELSAVTPPLVIEVRADAEIVVERAQYWGEPLWQAGTCEVATPLPVVYRNELAFLQAAAPTHHESFDQLAPGTYPPALVLGEVSVANTTSASSTVCAPGPHYFATNFLTAIVASNDNDVVLTLPPGTRAAGMRFVASPGYPGVLVTAEDDSGRGTTAHVMAGDPFVGFVSGRGVSTLRFSAPPVSFVVSTANIGDIWYTR